jgi:hypothetical protein
MKKRYRRIWPEPFHNMPISKEPPEDRRVSSTSSRHTACEHSPTLSLVVVLISSRYDQDVGYTQGLAFIVAALLLNMPEEEAFCVLIRLMYSYDLRSHFLPDMPGLQLRMYQFDRLLEELLPALHLHLVRAGVKSSMYASQWFMTMFSYRYV